MKNHSKILFFYFITLSFFSFTKLDEPTKVSWETLKDVTFKKKWNAQESMFVLYPTFGAKVNSLKDKEIILTGYMIPVDVDANVYVLSANPYSSCFFCGGAGPESVVQIKFKKSSKRFNTDDRVSIKGILKLNADDINELNYMLVNSEVVQ